MEIRMKKLLSFVYPLLVLLTVASPQQIFCAHQQQSLIKTTSRSSLLKKLPGTTKVFIDDNSVSPGLESSLDAIFDSQTTENLINHTLYFDVSRDNDDSSAAYNRKIFNKENCTFMLTHDRNVFTLKNLPDYVFKLETINKGLGRVAGANYVRSNARQEKVAIKIPEKSIYLFKRQPVQKNLPSYKVLICAEKIVNQSSDENLDTLYKAGSWLSKKGFQDSHCHNMWCLTNDSTTFIDTELLDRNPSEFLFKQYLTHHIHVYNSPCLRYINAHKMFLTCIGGVCAATAYFKISNSRTTSCRTS
jgi:hypothetical protein